VQREEEEEEEEPTLQGERYRRSHSICLPD
jgi:hypothetical protein